MFGRPLLPLETALLHLENLAPNYLLGDLTVFWFCTTNADTYGMIPMALADTYGFTGGGSVH